MHFQPVTLQLEFNAPYAERAVAAVVLGFNDPEHSLGAWSRSSHVGAPVLEDVCAHPEWSVFSVLEAGDHRIIVGRILSGTVTQHRPLTYRSGQHVDFVYKLAS
ncbi:flavin reductase [Mesorhizobium sp. M4A.F.Ca.ET.022.05.2.1]|uniref:flavin reductase family protein n=1 Tax=Mesorhizobium sp. M4A.F.Ca.ET.022.05.2.1 TaxID=2496653 RepID=UPI000FCBFC68|nr:flavin reductase family protein [Mesorhizobium sp. M4A.F.Ca.ET.022.05.2.1]RVC82249.1 flavin reductase [Mesorhizobium sp. M4A.F.Ca.ET.022.05.2.1]